MQSIAISVSVCLSVCLHVCLSVRSHIVKNARPDFTKFSVLVTRGRGLVILCTSGFIDEVMFSCHGAVTDTGFESVTANYST